MIRTLIPVVYDPRSPENESVVYAEIVSVIRNPKNKTYTLKIEESILIDYEQEVPVLDDEGEFLGTEIQVFQSKKIVKKKERTMSYSDSNNLTDYLDVMFEINETKTERRDRYTVLGHLVVNNQEQVYGTNWVLD
jgi:hypothetical protein